MSTGQAAVMLCGREVKAGWLIPFVDKRVGGRHDSSLTCVILGALEVNSHEKALYKCPVFFFFFFFPLQRFHGRRFFDIFFSRM